METVAIIVGIIAGIVTTLAGLLGIWFRLRHRSDKKPSVGAEDKGIATGGSIINSTITTGGQPTVAKESGVAIGPGHTGPITVIQQGPDKETQARLARVEAQLKELQDKVAAPPEGTPPVETEALIAEATEETERLLNEALELQRQHKEREAIDCLLEAYRRDLPPIAKAELHVLAGNGFLNLTELEEAEGHYRQALAAAKEAGHQQGEAAALGNLGVIYSQRGDLDKAEQHHKKSFAIKEEIGDRLGQANSLGNLGIVYKERGDLDRAEEYHKKALAIDEEIGNRLGQAQHLGNLGIVYAGRGDLDRAEEYFKKALAIQEEIGNRLGQANQLGNLGNVYSERGDLDNAEEHHKKALAIDEKIGNRLGQAADLANLGTVYYQRDDLDQAQEHYQKALLLFQQIGAQPQVTQAQRLVEELRSATKSPPRKRPRPKPKP